MTSRFALAGLVVGLIAGVAPSGAGAREARPDTTFGGGRGWVTTRIPGAASLAYGAALVRDGKIAIAGQTLTRSGNGQVLVARYQRNGRLDGGFGSRGIFKTALPATDGPLIATSVLQQRSTGRLLVAGGYGQDSMLLMRLTSNGRLDRTFGRKRSGLVTIPAGGIAESIALQRNGGILLGGSNENRNGRPMVVARFSRNGALDRRFGRRGLAQALFWNPNRAASAGVIGLATAPDDGIIASGHIDYIGSDGHGSAGVFRLSSRGRLVRSFGSKGHVEVAFRKTGGGFGQWFPCVMAVNARAAITVAGDGSIGARAAILSIRLLARGTLDLSYGKGGTGRAVAPGPRSESTTTCGATSSPAGALTVGVGSILAQLRADGRPNTRFAHHGFIPIANPRHASINAVTRWGSRRIAVAGLAGDAVYLARYVTP